MKEKNLTDHELQALARVMGSEKQLQFVWQHSEVAAPTPAVSTLHVPTPITDPSTLKSGGERRTPIVPEESGLRMEDWLAPIQDSMKRARENLALVAEEFVRTAAAGNVSYDTFDQQRKALEYLTAEGKKSEDQDKKLSKGAVTIRDALQGTQKSMIITAASLGGLYTALHRFASAAQPGVMRAMDKELQLLTAQLGTALMPVILDVTEGLFDLVDWFSSLDDGTKKLIAGSVVAVPVLMGLTSAVGSLAPAARLAAAGMTTLIASLGPIGAVVAAIGVSAAGAAASVAAFEYFSRSGHASPEVAGRAGTAVRESEVTDENLRSLRDLRHGTETTREQLGALSREELNQLTARARTFAQQNREAFPGSTHPTLVAIHERGAKFDALATILERMALAGFMSLTAEKEEARREGLLQRARRLNAIATEAKMEQRPHYSGLTDIRKELQTNILGKSPIDQEILRLQRANLPSIDRRLQAILEELRRPPRLPQT